LYAVIHHDPAPLTGSREIELLDQVVRLAIAKRPEARYPSARKMLEALNAITITTSTATLIRPQTVTRLIALPFRLLKKDEDTDFLAHSLPDAVCNSLSGIDSGFARANEAFAKAFALNPDLAIAHNLYTLIECDQGRAQQATLRLLQRARFRRNDPELFDGLVQACRYCDQLDASLAAHFRSRHLDPHATTSAAHTYFMLGEYQKSLECYGDKAGYYLDCAALAALGDTRTAITRLRQREQSGGAPGHMRALMQSLRAYLEGNSAECLQVIESGELFAQRDLESQYYTGRHLALIGEMERAIKMLSGVVEDGFLCGSALTRDPSFASLRSSPAFSELIRFVEARRTQVHAAFLEAGGPEILNLAFAVL
jgi:tetratricopeptide (TPR) repeat protein